MAKAKDIAKDDTVRSTKGQYRGTYRVVKTKKSVCWIKPNFDDPNFPLDPDEDKASALFKNIPYGILTKV